MKTIRPQPLWDRLILLFIILVIFLTAIAIIPPVFGQVCIEEDNIQCASPIPTPTITTRPGLLRWVE